MMLKEIFSATAIALTVYAFFPYIRSIKRGQTRPHVFSWIIWGSTTFVIFLAQLADEGGPGAWPVGVSGIITMYVAFLAYKQRADTSITRLDWIFLVIATSALPAWYITSDPLWSVVILTLVDSAGFVPTFRKAFLHPYEENLTFYNLIVIRNTLVLLALMNYSWTTVLFPAVMAVLTILFVFMVIVRRKIAVT